MFRTLKKILDDATKNPDPLESIDCMGDEGECGEAYSEVAIF
jgi:hypothetical protein